MTTVILQVLKMVDPLTRSVTDSEEVEVLGTPRKRCHSHFLHLVIAELPQWQQSAFTVTVLVSQVLVVAEIYTRQQLQLQLQLLLLKIQPLCYYNYNRAPIIATWADRFSRYCWR